MISIKIPKEIKYKNSTFYPRRLLFLLIVFFLIFLGFYFLNLKKDISDGELLFYHLFHIS